MKNTELNLIPIFVAIYEENSLSKAARRLEISQPAVSKALARLRELYNEPLFHRTPSGVKPTSFAMDIYPAMSASLKNFTSTLSTTTAFDPKQSQRVFSIACNSLVSYSLIPTLMRNIQTTAPHISIEVHPLFTEDYESDLRQQRYDIVIDRVPREHTNLKYKIIGKEQLTLVCSVDHPRVKESVTLEQYMNEQHVVSSTWQSRQAVLSEQDLAELNKREVRCSAAGIAEMLAVVEGSEFICLSTQSMFKRFGAHYNLKSVPSPADEFVFDLAIIWHPSRTNEPGHVWLRKEVEKTNTYKQ